MYWSSKKYRRLDEEKSEEISDNLSLSESNYSESEDESLFSKQKAFYSIQQDPFPDLVSSVSPSFYLQHIFQIEEREPGNPPDKREYSILHNKRLPIPTVPLLNTSHYLNLISQLPNLQKSDADLLALRIALKIQNPINLLGTITTFYPTAYIAMDSQLTWVHHNHINKILISTAAQLPLIELLHSSPHYGCHYTIAPTIHIIKYFFIWSNMKSHILAPLVTKTFHRVHIDSIVGLLITVAPGRFTYVLTIVDAFTKFLLPFPLASLQAPQIVRCFNRVFTIIGAPLVIIANNGSEFKNKTVAEFLRAWGIFQRFTTSHNPQFNGQTEAMVKIIVNQLKIHLRHLASARSDAKYFKGSWVSVLPQLIYSYNITP